MNLEKELLALRQECEVLQKSTRRGFEVQQQHIDHLQRRLDASIAVLKSFAGVAESWLRDDVIAPAVSPAAPPAGAGEKET